MSTDMENLSVVADDIARYNPTSLISMASEVDEMVEALNKIMRAVLKATTPYDWTLIGGKPYLQETGATKVARVFGISWRVLSTERELDKGYPKYTYRMELSLHGITIESDGIRSGNDEFFTGKVNKKGPDEIDAGDVQKAAYTNCLNNGIKRLLPGLRNIDVDDLKAAGFDMSKVNGYTFKTGTQGGNDQRDAGASGLVCDGCGTPITQKVASYSQAHHDGAKYCMSCQKNPPAPKPAAEPKAAAPKPAAAPKANAAPTDGDDYLPDPPPESRR